MSVVAVAKKDFQDAIRSRVLWAISAFFALLVVGLAAAYANFDILNGGDPTGEGIAQFLASSISLFVAITAIIACNRSIAGERESGSLRLLLSLPHTRLDVVLGKTIGRTGVLSVPILGSMVIGAIVGSAIAGVFDPVPLVVALFAAFLFIASYVGLMVGLSALTKSTTLAIAGGVAFFLIMEVLWQLVRVAILFVANGFSLQGTAPDWNYILLNVPPSNAFSNTFSILLESTTDFVDTGTAPPDTFYGTRWLGLVFLVLWFAVPLAVGYFRFSTTDL